MKQTKKRQRQPPKEQLCVNFLDALASRDINKAQYEASQLPSAIYPKAYDATLVLKDYLQLKRQRKTISQELTSATQQLQQLRLEYQELQFKKEPFLKIDDKMRSSIIQSVRLLSRSEYKRAYNQTLSQDVKKLTRQLWEYNYLKSYSRKLRSKLQVKIDEPVNTSQTFRQVKNILKGQNDHFENIHEQYEEALNQILSFNAQQKELPLVSQGNKEILQRIEESYKYLISKERTLNEQDENGGSQDQFQFLQDEQNEPQLNIQSSKKEVKKPEEKGILRRQYFTGNEVKNKLGQIEELMREINQSRSELKRGREHQNMQMQVLEDVTNFLRSHLSPKPKIEPKKMIKKQSKEYKKPEYPIQTSKIKINSKPPKSSLPVFDQKIMEQMQERNVQLQKRQFEIREDLIKINKNILEADIIEAQRFQIDESTLLDEIIENTMKNSQILVKAFALIRVSLIEASKNVKSNIFEGQDSIDFEESGLSQFTTKTQSINKGLISEKLKALDEQIVSLIEQNNALKDQLQLTKSKLKTKIKLNEDLKKQNQELQNIREGLKTKISKQIVKIKYIEESVDLSRSMVFDDTKNQVERNESILTGKVDNNEMKKSMLGQPPKLQASIPNEDNTYLKRKNQILREQLQKTQSRYISEIQSKTMELQKVQKVCLSFQHKVQHLKKQKQTLQLKKSQLTVKVRGLEQSLQDHMMKRNQLQNQVNRLFEKEQCCSICLKKSQNLIAKNQSIAFSIERCKSEEMKSSQQIMEGQILSLKDQITKEKEGNRRLTGLISLLEDKVKGLMANYSDQVNKLDDLRDQLQKAENNNAYIKAKVQYLEGKRQEETRQKNQKIQSVNSQVKKLKGQLQQKQLEQRKYLFMIYEKNDQNAQLSAEVNSYKRQLQKMSTKMTKQTQPERQEQGEYTRQEAYQHNTQILVHNQHLFTSGDIFDGGYNTQRLELIRNIDKYVGVLKRTKLLYRYQPYNKVNFHKYIDNHKHVLLVMKTIYGKMIAAYSEECFNSSGIKKGNAMLMSLWNNKIYSVHKGFKGITYDEYYIIYGNSEVRIKSLQTKVFSNFGVRNGYYDTKGDKVDAFLGDKDREVDLLGYQVYELVFRK